MSNNHENNVTFVELEKVDIRVGVILSAEEVDNDSEYMKLKVDIGELGVRDIVAKFNRQYAVQTLVRYPTNSILVIVNTEPTVIKGLPSHGVILGSFTKDKNIVNLITSRDVKPGAEVHLCC